MTKPARSTYHHGDLPSAVLDALDETITRRGVAATSLREVARRAGVSPAAPAHHFGNKRGMLTAFVAQGFEQFNRSIDESLGDVEGTGERLVACAEAYIRFALDRPGRFSVMFRPDLFDETDPRLRAAGDRAFDTLRGLVAAHQANGWRSAEDTRAVSVGVWGAIHGLAELWRNGLVDEELRSLGVRAMVTTTLAATVGIDGNGADAGGVDRMRRP